MANSVSSGIKYIDTGGATDLVASSTVWHVKEVQWIDDAGDIADGDDLALEINGVSFALKANKASDVGDHSVVQYRMGPYAEPLHVSTFKVTTIDHGVVLVIT